MGSTMWSEDFYRDRETERARTGTSAFAYHATVSSKPVAARRTHEKMDPKGVTRESRDSAEHPNSVAIGVVFDVTGSMADVPVTFQKKLGQLMGLLTQHEYMRDPQILFGAVGDYHSDKAPLQVGQFESGIEMDDDLGRVWLESGGGGGEPQESYGEALYFFARHTSTDCFEKRGKKGYLFLFGDEKPYPTLTKKEIERVFGDAAQADLTIEQIVEEAKEKFNVYFIIPSGTAHYRQNWLFDCWAKLLGAQNVLKLDDPSAISEAVATIIGLQEGSVDLAKARENLEKTGSSKTAIDSVLSALGAPTPQGPPAKAETPSVPKPKGKSKAARL